jgi:hypothetical protein
MPNLLLDLDCQLEFKKHLYEKIITYMHKTYSNELLKLKNMNWFYIYTSLYMHFCVWFLFGISYKDIEMYD